MGRRLGFCGGGEGSLLLRRGRSCGVGFVLPAVVVIMAGAALADVMLESDTTWNGSVVVDQTTRVPAGVTLRVEAGTTVALGQDVALIIEGRLLAEGTEAEPILWTRHGSRSWKQIRFTAAQDSLLQHCIIEFADSEGDHKDYYDNDCDPETPLPSRDYHEAVVVVASHVDMDGCVFRHLPDDGSRGEGDAIAVISDDPDVPGTASATIRNCQFLSIGQGVHTRFSYVLVEGCYFTGHHGDNDDVDLYGESTPPPMIRNNILIYPAHDDMINPTRCSAWIVGNVIGGCDDHGVVLRDKSAPVVMNNVIFDCRSAGIAVQNQCDALLVNNTIVDCGRGVRFFDHTGRWGPPYCLYPGSGRATLINNIIWDCPTTFQLADSPWTEDRGSHATVAYCDIQDGQDRASVSSHSTLAWGEGNIEADPLFADAGAGDFHLQSAAGRWDADAEAWVVDGQTSPCIDAGDPADPNWVAELWPHGRRINMGTFGGTAEASLSLSAVGSAADISRDGTVNVADLAELATDWTVRVWLLRTDVNRDGRVDVADLADVAAAWLETMP